MSSRTLIVKVLTRKHGLNLTADATLYLENMLQEAQVDQDAMISTLDYIAQAYLVHSGQILTYI